MTGASTRRIVSLVPSSTESVCRLGAAAQLVGCTRYCVEPAADLHAVARIGGTKNPDREAIARLAPELVLANAEENRAEDITWLAARFPMLVQTPRTVAEARAALRDLAQVLGATAALAPIEARIAAAVATLASAGRRPRPRVFYAVWCKPWMGINRDTFVHDVLTLAGAVNVCADLDARYPRVDPSALVANGLDLVLLPSEPWAFDAEQATQLAAAGTFGTAVLRCCDGRDVCWHGVHLAVGLERVAAVLTPLPA